MSENWKKIGVVGVDSGSMMLADPAYTQGELPPYDKLVGLKKSTRVLKSKDKYHRFSRIKFAKGHFGAAVITEAGYGDGLYDVFIQKNKEGRVAALKVQFIKSKGKLKDVI